MYYWDAVTGPSPPWMARSGIPADRVGSGVTIQSEDTVTMNMPAVGLVLAAGQSKRMGFNKLTTNLAGQPMVRYALDHLNEAGVSRVIVVVGGEGDPEIREILGDHVQYVIQESPRGTGDAVLSTLPHLGAAKTVVVLFGDCPFIDGAQIRALMAGHEAAGNAATIATALLENAANYGRVERDADGMIMDVLENRDGELERERAHSAEIFAGLSVWRREVVDEVIPRLPYKQKSSGSSESDLPDAVGILRLADAKVGTMIIPAEDALGPNRLEQFRLAAQQMKLKKLDALMRNGVSIADPETVTVDANVEVRHGTKLLDDTQLYRYTFVGEGCTIGPHATLDRCTVGAGSRVGPGHWEGTDFPAGSVALDRTSSRHLFFRRPHFQIVEEANTCFVIMPFKAPYEDIYKNAMKPTLERLGYQCRIASDQSDGPDGIMEDIWESINRAEIVIADLSEPNPNVWYELGIAHALNKPVMRLFRIGGDGTTERLERLPFDVAHLRAVMYDAEKYELIPALEKWLVDYRTRRAAGH